MFQCFSVSVAAEQGKVFPQGLSDTTSCFCNFILAKSQPLLELLTYIAFLAISGPNFDTIVCFSEDDAARNYNAT